MQSSRGLGNHGYESYEPCGFLAVLVRCQVVDAMATPVVGVLADRLGNRKLWHFIGTITVFVSFPLIFMHCPGSSTAWSASLYYATFIVVFQIGWAMVQISHLSLITDLTPRKEERAELTAIRYTASVCAGVGVYSVTWVVFHATKTEFSEKISLGDDYKFREIAQPVQDPGPSTSKTNLFSAISPIPETKIEKQVGLGRKLCRKQHLEILTSTPVKRKLEVAQGASASHHNTRRVKEKKKIKKQPTSESSEVDCSTLSDDEMDEAVLTKTGKEPNELCCICGEIGRDKELWYRCVSCSSWNHAECTAVDTPKDYDIVIAGSVVGLITTVWFHLGVPKTNTIQRITESRVRDMTSLWQGTLQYLCSLVLLQVALLYVASRMFHTLCLVYMPLYLSESVSEDSESLATVPLLTYIASFVPSFGIKYLSNGLGNKTIYMVGATVSVIACLWIQYGSGEDFNTRQIYGVAILLGIGSSTTMISSLCLTADLIGIHTEQGAFVYSAVTFADKLLNGIVVFIIEYLMTGVESEAETCEIKSESALHHAKAEKAYKTLKVDEETAKNNPNSVVLCVDLQQILFCPTLTPSSMFYQRQLSCYDLAIYDLGKGYVTFYMECPSKDLCPHYYRDILVMVCGGSAILGMLVLATLTSVKIGQDRYQSSLHLVVEHVNRPTRPLLHKIENNAMAEIHPIYKTNNSYS
uniref:Uncharacterized protein n=1 Tax=Timema cristinae TaxID=61476 RepID=A0A7R9CE96_TIMCR|nr:unnamed protein product [Timema cristinae]